MKFVIAKINVVSEMEVDGGKGRIQGISLQVI
jgi:hypothetical protein